MSKIFKSFDQHHRCTADFAFSVMNNFTFPRRIYSTSREIFFVVQLESKEYKT